MSRWMNPFRAVESLKKVAATAAATKDAARADHERALACKRVAEKQAEKLGGMDRRNHYSESLTQAFQGKRRPA